MQISKKHQPTTITVADGIEVGKKYLLNNGYYKGQAVQVLWISPSKILFFLKRHYRQVQCQLLSKNIKVNCSIRDLVALSGDPKARYKAMRNVEVIKEAKSGNIGAVQEYIRRFKKKPNFNN